MMVGILELSLRIPASHSLKDKRQVLQSLIEQARRKYNVSVAEVGHQDAWQSAVIGFACVANDRRFLEEALAKVETFVESDLRVEIIGSRIEIL